MAFVLAALALTAAGSALMAPCSQALMVRACEVRGLSKADVGPPIASLYVVCIAAGSIVGSLTGGLLYAAAGGQGANDAASRLSRAPPQAASWPFMPIRYRAHGPRPLPAPWPLPEAATRASPRRKARG